MDIWCRQKFKINIHPLAKFWNRIERGKTGSNLATIPDASFSQDGGPVIVFMSWNFPPDGIVRGTELILLEQSK